VVFGGNAGAATGKAALELACTGKDGGGVGMLGGVGFDGVALAASLPPVGGWAFQLVLDWALDTAASWGVGAEFGGSLVMFSGCALAANGCVLLQPVPARPVSTKAVHAAIDMVRIPTPRVDFGSGRPADASCAADGLGRVDPSRSGISRGERRVNPNRPADRCSPILSPREFYSAWRRSWPRR